MKRTVFLGAAFALLGASIGTSAANVALPAIATALGGEGSAQSAQGVALSYLLSLTAMSLVAGVLGDRFGHRPVLLAGTGVFTLAAAGAALSPSLVVLVAARAVQGAGAAVMMVLPLAIVRGLTDAARTGRAMGTLGSIAAIGTAAGPAAGGLLLGAGGWQAVFAAMIPLGALAALLSLPGSASTGMTRKPAGGRSPALPLLRPRAIGGGAALNLLVGAVMMSTLVVGPFYLSAALGLSSAVTGLVMAAGPVVSIATGALAGRLVDRRGPTRMTAAGLGGMVLGTTALALLPPLWGVAGYMVGTMTLAPGYQLFLAANSTWALLRVRDAQRGAAAGLLSLARNLGLIVGASLVAGLFFLVADTAGAALDDGLRLTFLTAACALLCAGAATIWSARVRPVGALRARGTA